VLSKYIFDLNEVHIAVRRAQSFDVTLCYLVYTAVIGHK